MRHAHREKTKNQNPNVPLSTLGAVQGHWFELKLPTFSISEIYATNACRTIQTIAPTARDTGDDITVFLGREFDDFSLCKEDWNFKNLKKRHNREAKKNWTKENTPLRLSLPTTAIRFAAGWSTMIIRLIAKAETDRSRPYAHVAPQTLARRNWEPSDFFGVKPPIINNQRFLMVAGDRKTRCPQLMGLSSLRIPRFGVLGACLAA